MPGRLHARQPRQHLRRQPDLRQCRLLTIDADYRGEVGIILINHSDKAFVIEDGERVGQMVVAQYSRVEWNETDTLDETERGTGGFGHTGVK